jgi:hypothetical protein
MTESIDVEVILNRVIEVIQDNLNDKCSAIDTRKNDTITLKQFGDKAYSILTTDAQNQACNPFLYVGCRQPGSQGIGPGTEVQLEIDLVTVLSIEGEDTTTWKRILRYQQALKEVVQENFRDFKLPGDLRIESLEPRPIEELGPLPYMGAGIRIKTTLA